MKMKTKVKTGRTAGLALGVLALAGQALAAGGRGAPLLTDDFSVKESFPERWRVSEAARFDHGSGALHVKGRGTVALATLLPPLPEDFWVEADLSYDESPESGYWAGFVIDDHLFLTLNGATWLHPTGEAAASGDAGKQCRAADYKAGNPMRIAVMRETTGGSCKYSFFLDGRPAGHFYGKRPSERKPLALRVWNCNVTVRKFGLFVLNRGDGSPNLVYNASCERTYRDGLPQLVNLYSRFPFGEVPLEEYEKRYLGAFRTDTSEKHSGERSIRVDVNEVMRSPSVWPWGTATVKGQAGVFSVWMKASVDDLPVIVGYHADGCGRTVRVGREWRRYEAVNPSLPAPGPYSPVVVTVKNPDGKISATLWLDDFQFELIDLKPGEKPDPAKTYATPFRLSDLDKDMFADRTKAVERPVLDVPELPQGVKPTADLDAWRQFAVRHEEFYNGVKRPTHATETYVACDREALYVGVRAFGESLANVGAPKAPRDTLMIYNNDGLELFLSPNRERKWHHLMANANGSVTDLFGEDIKWNGAWTMEAKANPSSGSVDYCVRIPAADFARQDMKDAWYVSFCRNDRGRGESLSMFRNLKRNYRQIELWPEARFPKAVIAAWRQFAPAEKGAAERKTEVVGRLNFYMNEPEAAFRIIRPDGTFETVTVPLADMPVGTNRVELTAKDGTRHPAEIVKLPYFRYATQINRFARCIERHGKKIFPLAKMSNLTWWTPAYAAGAAELYGRIGGLNAILETESGERPNVLEGKRRLDEVLARLPNLYRIHEFHFMAPGPEAGEELREKARRQHKYLQETFEAADEDVLLTGVLDEPELSIPSETCYALVKKLRPNYPYRPMMINYTHMGIPNNYANLETDILSLDDYLTSSFGRTVADSLVNVDICSAAGKRLHRPSFACMVSGNTPYNCREPSQAEQVAQCYGAFAGGINGFFIWGDVPYSRGDWEGNKQVSREFTELTPYILTEEPDPEVGAKGAGPALRWRCCRFDKDDTLVAVNVDEKPAGRVTFTLPADRRDAAKVKVLFENREIAVKDGRFADDFADLSRHVYRW